MKNYYQKEIETASREEILAIQNEKIVKQVRHVYDNVAYYRKLMDSKGVKPEDIRGVEDIKKLPFLSKADLRDAYPYGLLATDLKNCVRIHSTSGTTGKRVVAFYTQHDIDLWNDCTARAIVAAGGTKDDVVQVCYGYGLFTVLIQVLLHQSIIGLETEAALKKYDIVPDIIIGCAGGGSNLGGLIAPFMRDKIQGKLNARIVAVEPASCPSFTRGVYAYDFCDTGMVCPLAKMYTLGSNFIPSANHAGGLRYHGMSSILSQLYADGLLEAVSAVQTDVFAAAERFARVEGILPAPESSHAIKVAIDEALKCKETGEAKNIVFGLTGTGYFDLTAYQKYNDGEMGDYIPTDEELQKSFATLPVID